MQHARKLPWFALAALLAVGVLGGLLWPREAPADAPLRRGEEERADPAPAVASANDAAPRRRLYLEVLSSAHAPVAGARVRAVAPLSTKEAITDAQGVALLEDVPGPLARLEATATGYAAQRFTAPKLPDDDEVSWTFTLDAAEGSAGRLKGAALVDGTPLEGALVLLVPPDDDARLTPEHLALTDGTGRFVADLARGEVGRVIALHRDHGVVDVTPGEADEVALELSPGGFLEGRVLSGGRPADSYDLRVEVGSQRAPLRQALSAFWRLPRARRAEPAVRERRRAVDALLRPRLEEIRDDEGRFRVGPLPPGAVRLSARAAGTQPGSLEVDAPSGATTGGLQLHLQAPLYVSGRVVDAESQLPIAGARVVSDGAEDLEMPGFGEAITDEEGRYQLATNSRQRHSLSVRARGYLPFDTGGLEGRAGEELIRDVELQPSDGRRHVREYVGIGATLRPHDEGATVMSVFESGPAAEHLAPGDVILRVDGTWVEKRSLREIVQRIVGEAGSEVELLVRRRGQSHTERVSIRRQRLSTDG